MKLVIRDEIASWASIFKAKEELLISRLVYGPIYYEKPDRDLQTGSNNYLIVSSPTDVE